MSNLVHPIHDAKNVDILIQVVYFTDQTLRQSRMTTNELEIGNQPEAPVTSDKRSRGGAYGIRGFQYQHAYGMLLAVKGYFGLSDLEKIVPEGSDDYEIHTSQGITLIDTKTVDEKISPRSVKTDAESFKNIWNKATKDKITVNDFHLVLNKSHKSYDVSNNKKALNLTDHQKHRDILDDQSKFDMSYIIVEEDPLCHAIRLVTRKLNVLGAIANIICSQVTHQIIDAAIANRHRSPTQEASLSKADISKVITDVLLVCKSEKVEKLIRTGELKECDFTPAPTSSELFLSVDVRLGHVTSDQVIKQTHLVASLIVRLKDGRRCFIAGPSGMGKSALMWQVVEATREKVCWYEISTKSVFDIVALTKFLRAASRHQKIGFVIDDVGSGKSEVLDQLILNTQGNENVWILGSIREEDLISSEDILSKIFVISSIKSGTVRFSAARNSALSFAKAFSIGLKSGLYGGRNSILTPIFSRASRTRFVLCTDKLSITSTSPGFSFFERSSTIHFTNRSVFIAPLKVQLDNIFSSVIAATHVKFSR